MSYQMSDEFKREIKAANRCYYAYPNWMRSHHRREEGRVKESWSAALRSAVVRVKEVVATLDAQKVDSRRDDSQAYAARNRLEEALELLREQCEKDGIDV